MHPLRLFLFWTIAMLAVAAVDAQAVRVMLEQPLDGNVLGLHDLHNDELIIPGVGDEVPGVAVEKTFQVKHRIGPVNHGAERMATDSTWTLLKDTRAMLRKGHGLHWIRFEVRPAQNLKGLPLIMAVDGRANYEIYLNGRFLMRSSGTDAFIATRTVTRSQRNFVPFSFVCDGKPEVIAVRIAGGQGASFDDTGFTMSLHEGDLFYGQQRLTTHYGIFIGTNIVVLLFSLVMWAYNRRERTWLFLALISALEVVGIYSELGTGLRVLGLGEWGVHAWRMVGTLALPWQLYLLVRVLGMLRGHEPAGRVKWTVAAAVLASSALALFGNGWRLRLDEVQGPLEWIGIILAVGLVLLMLAALLWFFILVVRLGFGLLRTKGYARWVGAGVVVSFVLAVVIRVAGAAFQGELSDWLGLVGNYANHAAVPLFTGVYLSIRSAHQNRLVKRQRDDLDAEVKERTAELRSEKERSEELLLNILPQEVAEELKIKGEADARLMEEVTVMFTDFKGFTALSEKMGPRELVADIHECFSAFDRIMEKYGVEKIKTIGDAYMAAGGLPVPNTTHARDVVRAALEVQEFTALLRTRREALGRPFFEIRIGVHTGPVVAGIVGVKKFQYDIWGDTVNTASRMESSGEAGRVNISASTYALVKDDPGLRFVPRGKVEAKGKGDLEMYFVGRARSPD